MILQKSEYDRMDWLRIDSSGGCCKWRNKHSVSKNEDSLLTSSVTFRFTSAHPSSRATSLGSTDFTQGA